MPSRDDESSGRSRLFSAESEAWGQGWEGHSRGLFNEGSTALAA